MDRGSAESMTDRELLVTTAVEVGVLNERTKGLPELKQRVTRLENDMGWMRRMFWGFAVPGTMSIVGLIVKVVRF